MRKTYSLWGIHDPYGETINLMQETYFLSEKHNIFFAEYSLKNVQQKPSIVKTIGAGKKLFKGILKCYILYIYHAG